MGIPWLGLAVAFSALADGFSLYLTWRQRQRHIKDEAPPSELREIVTQAEFEQSNAYQRDILTFALIRGSWDCVTELILLIVGFYPFLWFRVESWVGSERHEAVKSLAFLITVGLIGLVEKLPWSVYGQFVIEERHGFNRTTAGLFVKDLAISTGLSLGLAVVLVPPFIWLTRWAGPSGFIYIWIACMALSVAFLFIIPTLIMPLFNKYEPLHDQELKAKVEALASDLKFPLTKLYQMDASKRSSHSNAFMYGFWKSKRIVLCDTLLTATHEEIVAILAHEIGHWKLWHVLITFCQAAVVLFLQLWLAQIFIFQRGPYESFGFHNVDAVVIGAFIFSLILTPLNFVLNMAGTLLSRRHEFQADAFAAKSGWGKPLRSALIRLNKENKAEYNPDWLYAWMNYTHPALIERLRALDDESKKSQ